MKVQLSRMATVIFALSTVDGAGNPTLAQEEILGEAPKQDVAQVVPTVGNNLHGTILLKQTERGDESGPW